MANRYIITCASCGVLTEVTRSDALTCGGKCRVSLHRHPERLNELRAQAKGLKISTFMILEACAVNLLRPDLAERVLAGDVTFADVRDEVRRAFCQLAFRAVAAEDAGGAGEKDDIGDPGAESGREDSN